MKILKIGLGALVALVLLALVFPLVYPINLYIPRLQKAIGAKLQQPVRIGEINIAYTPMPSLVLHNVRVGANQEANISTAVVFPDYLSLFSDDKIVKKLVLDDATVKQDFVELVPAMLRASKAEKSLKIEAIHFNQGQLRLNKTVVGPLNADLVLQADGSLKELVLAQVDDSAKLKITPLKDRYRFMFEAQDWEVPGGSKIRISALTMNATGNADGVDFDDIRGVLYGGTYTGVATLQWSGRWVLAGRMAFSAVQTEALTTAVSPLTYVTGRTSGDINFTSAARQLEDLFAAPSAAMRFTASEGVVNNIDVISAIRSVGSDQVPHGGKTSFDTLTGSLRIADGTYRFSDLSLQSGVLQAGGSLTVTPDKHIFGSIPVRLKSAVNPMSAPIAVTGTLEAPQLHPQGNPRGAVRKSGDERLLGDAPAEGQ